MSPIPSARRFASALYRAGASFAQDDGVAIAGYMAYSALLALFPFLLFVTALAGVTVGWDGFAPVLEFMFGAMPEHVAMTLAPVVLEVLGSRAFDVLSLSGIGAIWIASNGVEALRVALERAYGISRGRPFWLNRLIAFGFVIAGAIGFLMLAVLIIFGPLIADMAAGMFSVDAASIALWNKLRYLIAVLLLLGGLLALHRTLPGRRPSTPIWPGAVTTMLIWMGLASAFSVYFRYAPSYTMTYGTLGGVIATLLFFYVSSIVFIFGAEVNAALAPRPLKPKDAEEQPESAPLL